MQEWSPLLVICPASLRLLWCEELEKWLPGLLPCDITIVQGSADWHPEAMETAFSTADTHSQYAGKAAGTDAAHTSQQACGAEETAAAENATNCADPRPQDDGLLSDMEGEMRLQAVRMTRQGEEGDGDSRCAIMAPSSAQYEHTNAVSEAPRCAEQSSLPGAVPEKVPQQAMGAAELTIAPCDACTHVCEPDPRLEQAPTSFDAEAERFQGAASAELRICGTSTTSATQEHPKPRSQADATGHKENSQRSDAFQQQASQHGGRCEVGGSPAKRRSSKIIIISYHMAANLSCGACKFPSASSSDSTSKPSPAKGNKGKGGVPCAGFPHCVAAGVFPLVIVDESHHMRTQSGPADNQMTEVTKQIVRNSKRAVLLSGTPSVTRPFDLAGQLHSLQPALMATAGGFGRFKTSLAFRYCQRRLIKTRRCESASMVEWIAMCSSWGVYTQSVLQTVPGLDMNR